MVDHQGLPTKLTHSLVASPKHNLVVDDTDLFRTDWDDIAGTHHIGQKGHKVKRAVAAKHTLTWLTLTFGNTDGSS